MAKGIFITGTDTGVGKTLVAGAIILALKKMGINTGGMKPIETGCRRAGNSLVPEDGRFLKAAASMYEHITTVVPCRLERPLAPMIAAELAGVSIDVADIRKKFFSLAKSYDALVVEGAGGIRVPIGKDYSMGNFAKSLRLPVVVVAAPGLGTINHTLLTVDYALGLRLKVGGVIINHSAPPGGTLAEETNAGALERLLPVPLLGVIPYMDDTSEENLELEALARLDMEKISALVA